MATIDCDANASFADRELLASQFNGLVECLHNPSSLHRGGQAARAQIEEAREAVRQLAGADRKDQVVFTSGATEANSMVVSSFAQPGTHVVSTAIEHPCILGPLAVAKSRGTHVALLAPDSSGLLSTDDIEEMVSEDTSFVSVMAANNETGVIQPVREIVERVRAKAPRAVIHCDAVQLPGKSPCHFPVLGVDILTLSAHKFGGLSGVGALIARASVKLDPLVIGGPQEGKLRGGTENVMGIALMGRAAEKVLGDPERAARMKADRDVFEARMLKALPDCEVHGAHVDRLPNTTSLFVPGVRADDLVVALDLAGILISAGAACSSGKPEPSHVLLAMGYPEERVRATVRVSMRGDYAPGTAERVAQTFITVVERMRRRGGSSQAA